jgi:hypothetical protein
MSRKPNLPPVIMETAYEATERAHGDDFADAYLKNLTASNGLGFLHDMVISGANEVAEGDPVLADKIRRYGCQLLFTIDSATTLQDAERLFDEPLQEV